MKKFLAALIALLLAFGTFALADYSETDAFNVAKHVIENHIKDIGGSKPSFAVLDYHLNKDGNRYALYSDVKYTDKKFKNQRTYFVVMFDETEDGIELYMMTFGTDVYLLDGFAQ